MLQIKLVPIEGIKHDIPFFWQNSTISGKCFFFWKLTENLSSQLLDKKLPMLISCEDSNVQYCMNLTQNECNVCTIRTYMYVHA